MNRYDVFLPLSSHVVHSENANLILENLCSLEMNDDAFALYELMQERGNLFHSFM